ncbi:MAG: hypothetical protein ACEPOV_11490 [Hyphomicrobiales bacterium]
MSKTYLMLLAFSALLINGLKAQNDTIQRVSKGNIPVLSLEDAEIDDTNQSGDISGLLSASRDPYLNTAGYTFGRARFRVRGYESQYTNVLFNNIPVNDPISGRVYWSIWGGLNDVTRNKITAFGVNYNDYGFGDIGGLTNIESRPSTMRPGLKVSYSMLNGAYRNRLMATYSSGMLANGWAFTVSASKRWAQEGYVKGTFYDAYAYYVGIEKKFSDNHSMSLVSFGAPSKRGKGGGSTEEAKELAGDEYYNPYWGYQNGEVRNARTTDGHQPMIILNDYLDLSSSTRLTTSAAYSFGYYSSSALSWYSGSDPRPDYYKNLPSYYKYRGSFDEYGEAVARWNTEAGRQIDFDRLILTNKKNLFEFENVDGIDGNNITALRSNYIIENRVADRNRFNVSSVLNSTLNENINLTTGFNVSIYKERNYKTIEDLLGGEYWLDVDKFAERDNPVIGDNDYIQSDLNHKNRLVKEGDKFGYDYTANVNQANYFAQSNFSYGQYDFYLGANLAYTSLSRTGHMKVGKFADNSYGDSKTETFIDYGVKGGATYKISGRHYVTANASYMTKAPTFRTTFISPRTRNDIVKDLISEKILSSDLSYIIRTPYFKSRATVYFTNFKDQTWQRSFYHEDEKTFVNYVMTGVDKINAGIELGLEGKITQTLTATAAANIGQYFYNSRPSITISRDNDSELLSDRVAYIKNYYVGGYPQNAASVGLKYDSPKYWWIGVNANYFWDIYEDINPDRRTAQALHGFTSSDNSSIYSGLIDQREYSNGMTVDLWAGKSWKIKDYYIRLNVSVNNLLDVRDFTIGGYEQLRYDRDAVDRFPSKTFNMYGRSFYATLSFSF